LLAAPEKPELLQTGISQKYQAWERFGSKVLLRQNN
ncbi:MAG: hypothetical protein ACI8T1_002473, partial [Verrucomicrobiales bacterium]